jgi:hypothetical protein
MLPARERKVSRFTNCGGRPKMLEVAGRSFLMNPILSTGVLIGLLCSTWTFVMGFTGWYKNPALANVLFIVVAMAIEVIGLIWGLRQTAALGRTYGGQILAGTMMAIVAGVIIIASSLLFTTVVFPGYFADIEQAYRGTLLQQGKTDAEIASAIQASAASATPMAQAMSGFIGTLVTGIVASAIIALFVRRRSESTPIPAAPR